MKNFFIIGLLLLIPFNLFSQIQDLTRLANGEIVYSDIIFDNQSRLWGYFYLYKVDKGKVLDKMEYVVLDKNLNKVYNGNFESPKSMTVSTYRKYNDCALMGDNLVLDISLLSTYELIYNSMRIISLKDSVASEEFFFDGKVIKPVPEKSEKINSFTLVTDSLKNRMIIYPVYTDNVKGFFMFPSNLYGLQVKEKKCDFYDDNKQLKWSYVFNPNTSNKSRHPYTSFSYLFYRNKHVYAIERDIVKNKVKSCRLIGLNFETGKKDLEYVIETDTSIYKHGKEIDVYNDTVYFTGNYYDKDFQKFLGYYRIALDARGNEIYKKYYPWKDLSTPEVTLKNKPVTSKGISLNRNAVVVYRDGSASIVHEGVKYRNELLEWIQFFSLGILRFGETTSGNVMVYQFDKNFNFKGIQYIKKNKSMYVDNFVFSRNNVDNTENLVLFFNNKKLDENKFIVERDLLISRMTADTIKTESIPLFQKEKYSIVPMAAKDGYILLWERNEKDKYNQIRLEKLNE